MAGGVDIPRGRGAARQACRRQPRCTGLAVRPRHGSSGRSAGGCGAIASVIGELGVLVRTPITFDVGKRDVHSPMVEASVLNVRTKLILDTGSTAHVFTNELVRRAGLEMTPAEPGTDHVGQPVESWDIGQVPIRLQETELQLQEVVSFDGPAPFEKWGIGGFLAPQELSTSAWVVIDLVGDTLTLLDGDESSIKNWLRSEFPTLHLMSLQRLERESVQIMASITPFGGEGPTMLNTGSSGTEIARNTVPGLHGTASEGAGFGLSGAEVAGEEVADQTLLVGDAQLRVPNLLVREVMPPEHPPAQIGMDLLRGTVLAIGPASVLWLVPV